MIDFENTSINPHFIESVEIWPDNYKDLAAGSTFCVVIIMESGRKYEHSYSTIENVERSKKYIDEMVDTYINPVMPRGK